MSLNHSVSILLCNMPLKSLHLCHNQPDVELIAIHSQSMLNLKTRRECFLRNQQNIKCQMMEFMWFKFGILDLFFQGFFSNPDITSQSECFRILIYFSAKWEDGVKCIISCPKALWFYYLWYLIIGLGFMFVGEKKNTLESQILRIVKNLKRSYSLNYG